MALGGRVGKDHTTRFCAEYHGGSTHLLEQYTTHQGHHVLVAFRPQLLGIGCTDKLLMKESEGNDSVQLLLQLAYQGEGIELIRVPITELCQCS